MSLLLQKNEINIHNPNRTNYKYFYINILILIMLINNFLFYYMMFIKSKKIFYKTKVYDIYNIKGNTK